MVVRSVGSQIATSAVHRLQPQFTDRNMVLQTFTVGRYTESNLEQITESNKGRHTRQLQAGVEVAFKQGTSQ